MHESEDLYAETFDFVQKKWSNFELVVATIKFIAFK
tara:strand:- start:9316 stop:9423 length:108 start_codon:yes stop_codon:yes gene_type:complete